MKPFQVVVSCLFCLSIQFGNAIHCFADDKEVRIGVLAFRPIEISKQQWQPTADYLNSKLPEYHFTITPLNYTDLDLAINRRQFDFVLTNPEHYITIREDHGISAIATLMPSIGGHPFTTFGGVIFTRSDRTDINGIDDIRDKVVASPSKQSLGGYSMQVWTLLKKGMQKNQIKQFRFTGMPHDNVVQEVIGGKADVGFVRTGVIEGMVRDGKIRLDQIKVLNRQPPEKFPLLLSTDLYPEWPLAAELDVPQALKKAVAIALFNMPPNDRAAEVGQYYGFSSTGDYSAIESLMKRISENPERTHEFELRDIVRKYSIQLQLLSLFVILVVFSTAIYLLRVNKIVVKISKEREQLTGELADLNSELETANRNLERTVEVRTSQLRVSEERYRRIVDTAREGIWELGPDALITFVNARMGEMLGYSEKEMIGRPASDFMFDEDMIDHLKEMENCCQGVAENYERRLLRKDGQTVWTLVSATPIFDDDRHFKGSFGMFSDITERKHAEGKLQKLNESLEQRVREETAKNMAQERLLIQQSRLAAMGEMIHNIAHQWRQPIHTLAVVLANIKDAYEFNELTREYLEMEVITGQHVIQGMSTTIDDFRNFFMPNKEKKLFLTDDAVENAIKFVSDSFAAHNVKIVWGPSVEPCIVLGYPNEFAQVVLNILTNAMEAIAGKHLAGEIYVGTKKDENAVVVSIRDNGGGIPEKNFGKVFDPYFSTKESGSGIGLYMSKMIMEHMDGDIVIRNIEDGVEVLLTLPLANPVV